MTFAAAQSSAGDFFDDEPTLVHPREVTEVRSRLAKSPIPPPLPLTLRRVNRELAPDDLWLASLPAATRATLDRARRGELACGRIARAS